MRTACAVEESCIWAGGFHGTRIALHMNRILAALRLLYHEKGRNRAACFWSADDSFEKRLGLQRRCIVGSDDVFHETLYIIVENNTSNGMEILHIGSCRLLDAIFCKYLCSLYRFLTISHERFHSIHQTKWKNRGNTGRQVF